LYCGRFSSIFSSLLRSRPFSGRRATLSGLHVGKLRLSRSQKQTRQNCVKDTRDLEISDFGIVFASNTVQGVNWVDSFALGKKHSPLFFVYVKKASNLCLEWLQEIGRENFDLRTSNRFVLDTKSRKLWPSHRLKSICLCHKVEKNTWKIQTFHENRWHEGSKKLIPNISWANVSKWLPCAEMAAAMSKVPRRFTARNYLAEISCSNEVIEMLKANLCRLIQWKSVAYCLFV
jgi:hypothetical protein